MAFVLAPNNEQSVSVLISSLCGSLATALSIALALRNHGDVSVYFVRLGIATDADSLLKVIISDSTCEIDDNDEKLHQVKFTWQFVDHCPHLQTSAKTDESRIFTESYNQAFN